MRVRKRIAAIFLVVGLIACAGCSRSSPTASASTPAAGVTAVHPSRDSASHGSHDSRSHALRAFFVAPRDDDTVTSPVQVQFGAQGISIASVPDTVIGAPRTNTGHYHLGVDNGCLSAGATIPQAAPWVHVGLTRPEIELDLPPGRHHLAIQVGDDRHVAIDALCATISIMVRE